jgi:hypothetical protein
MRPRNAAVDTHRNDYFNGLAFPNVLNWTESQQLNPDSVLLMLASEQRPGVIEARNDLWFDCCGVRSFERGRLEVLGGNYVTINVACLDSLEPAELAAASITYMDGRNNWFSRPLEVRHL